MTRFETKTEKKLANMLLEDKRSRAVVVVTGFTPPSSEKDFFGEVVLKGNKNGKWREYRYTLREDFGEMIPGDQWIAKFDEEFSRVITLHTRLHAKSERRIKA